MDQIIRKQLLFVLMLGIGTVMYLFFDKSKELVLDCQEIINLELGSSIDTVISKIGPPLTIEGKWHTHDFKNCNRKNVKIKSNVKNEKHLYSIINRFKRDTTYCCDSFKSAKMTRGLTLTYTNSKSYEDYTMLWIHLDKDYKLVGVYSKLTDGWDDKKELYKNYSENYYLDPKFCSYIN